jgi:DNA-binding transcriptional ArsR family regulator
VEHSGVFAALSDPTRRLLVEWLSAEESGTATGFAARLPISRQAVARHLQELEHAGLVRSERVGRETRFSLETEPLTEAAGWLEQRTEVWDSTLGRLKRHLEAEGAGDAP